MENIQTKTVRGRPKDPEKAKQIMEAAAELFMEKGLKGTSMDAVAVNAGVSKQTLYSHFKGKDDLYRAVMKWQMDIFNFSGDSYVFSGDLKTDLNEFGCHVLNLILDHETIAMVRTVIAEGTSYKKTSQLFYENGPDRVRSDLEAYLSEHDVENSRFYAVAFLNMLEQEWQMKALMNLREKPSQKEIEDHVETVTHNFMKMIAT